MRYLHCPVCGEKLGQREVGDEGLTPWCGPCSRPWFDTFATCVICAVVNDRDEVALLRQTDLSKNTRVCVSGYMKPGESAEDAAAREILEELGLEIDGIEYMGSWPMPERSQLMLGFRAHAPAAPLRLSREIQDAAWFPFDHALPLIREGSVAWRLVERAIRA